MHRTFVRFSEGCDEVSQIAQKGAGLRHGCTLNEMPFFIGMVALASGGARLVWLKTHNFWLAAGGLVIGFALLPVVAGTLAFIDSRARPIWPRCERGSCPGWKMKSQRVFDTKYIDSTKQVRASLLRCDCADEYIHLDGRLMIVRGDGKWHPFRKRVKPCVWVEDDGRSVLDADVQEVVWEREREPVHNEG